MAIIQYTGHPLVDVGAATIAAFVGKDTPEEVTEADLAQVVGYIEDKYSVKPMRSFLTVLFPNSGYVQPAFDRLPEKRKAYTNLVLSNYQQGNKDERQQPCVFCGRPAAMKAFRQHIPLLGGESIINFYPEGGLGLSVCGACMLCIQAFPLGTVNCNGRALVVHSDRDEIIYGFASHFLAQNRATLQRADLEKMPKLSFPRTTLMQTLMMLNEEHDRSKVNLAHASITAYHITNYGTNADVNIYHLPLKVLSFLATATGPTYKPVWNGIVAQAWDKSTKSNEDGEGQRRNYLYEDLFNLPQDAVRFLRTYFMRQPLRQLGRGKPYEGDPRRSYNLGYDGDLLSWPLTKIFLKEVVGMDEERIKAIEELADRLADYAAKDNRILAKIHRARRYDHLRLLLVSADLEVARGGQPPLLTFNRFITVFEEGAELPRKDWSLVRDLIIIRMVERLYEKKQLDAEALKEMVEDNETQLEDIAKAERRD